MNTSQKQQIEFTTNSATVHVNASMGWVTITDKEDDDNSIFLQGEDAGIFLEEAERFYESVGDVSTDDAYAFVAYDYLDMLGA
jgi:hypothetical protein